MGRLVIRQRFKARTKSRGRRFAQPGMTFRNGLGCSHARHRICTQSESESVKPVKLFSPDSLLDRSEFVGPVRQSPTIDIYTTDGVVARHTALYVGNLLTATLKLFRQWKIVFSICPNGSGYNFPPFFQRKFPNATSVTDIDESALKRSPFVPFSEFSVFSEPGECFREGFGHGFTSLQKKQYERKFLHRHKSLQTLESNEVRFTGCAAA